MAQGGNERSTGSTDVGSRFAGYQIYDRHYEKVGTVDDLFVDENDSPEYIGVKTGFFGSHSSLIPMEITRVNDERRLVQVNTEIDAIKNSPTFDDDEEINPEFEDRVYAHFGLKREGPASSDRGGYGEYYGEDNRSGAGERSNVDTEYGERTEFYDLPIDAEGTDQGRESAGRESAGRESAGHESAGHESAGREREYGQSTGERSSAAGPGMAAGGGESDELRGRDEEYSSRSIGEERGHVREGQREDRSADYRDTGADREEDRASGSSRAGEERYREDFGEAGPGVAAGGREGGEARSGSDTSYRGGGSSGDSSDREPYTSGTGHAGEERRDREREERGEAGPGMRVGDTESGEFRGHASDQEGLHQPGSDLEDRDELRVQRSEEELRVGTREREAGSVRVRKRVRTDRERMRVPKRREEVTVERVPVEGREASEAEIGGGEVRMPVVEEEVVVEKRPVVKEEIRVRKDMVQGEEVVEEDVRKEEVDVTDETARSGDAGGSTERRDR